MNLYDKSSLILVPGAVKDGKVYSQRPENGDGDFTFSRGSSATRVDENGLIEKGRENFLLRSNQFDTTWYNTTSSETSGQIGYDGSNDAWELSISAAAGRLTQLISLGGVQTFSVYAKAGTYNFLNLYAIGNVAHAAYFDLSAGSVGTTFSLIDSSITSVGNGWYRCSITFSDTTLNVRFYPAVADNDLTGTSGSIYIQNAQLEAGLVATDYIESTTTTAVSGITEDLPRLDYSGGASCPSLKLEPQRTNLITHSEYLGGAFSLDGTSLDYNYGVSPEGVSNSALLTQTGSVASNSIYNFGLPTTDGSYTYSFFFKAGTSTKCRMYVGTGVAEDFNPQTITAGYSGGTLNILFEDYGDGWWRASATQTLSGAGTNRFSIYPDRSNQGRNVEIWGTRVESGSYPSSYIPTYGASVTKLQDECSVTGVSDLIGQTEGTIFVEAKIAGDDASNRRVINLSDGTTSNRIEVYAKVSSSQLELAIRDNGVDSVVLTSSSVGLDTTFKMAIAYASNDCAYYVNGTLVGTDSSVVVPSTSKITFGRGDGNFLWQGEINQALLFKTRLSNEELADLTTI